MRNSIDAPDRLMEFLTELELLYKDKVGTEEVGACGIAIQDAYYLNVAQVSVPVTEIHQGIVGNDPDSSVSVGSSTSMENENQGTGTGSVESMNTSSIPPSVESMITSVVGSATSMSIDAESNRGTVAGNPAITASTGAIGSSLTGSANRGSGSESVASMDISNV